MLPHKNRRGGGQGHAPPGKHDNPGNHPSVSLTFIPSTLRDFLPLLSPLPSLRVPQTQSGNKINHLSLHAATCRAPAPWGSGPGCAPSPTLGHVTSFCPLPTFQSPDWALWSQGQVLPVIPVCRLGPAALDSAAATQALHSHVSCSQPLLQAAPHLPSSRGQGSRYTRPSFMRCREEASATILLYSG